MKKFTIQEIKNYILSKDSLDDVLCFLTEENIEKANEEAVEDTFLDNFECKYED